VLRKCSVFNSGRNFGLFVLRECSVFISGRNFGLFASGKCSVCNGGRSFGSFVLKSVVFSLVDAILAYLHWNCAVFVVCVEKCSAFISGHSFG
jgi:hypothetical protein